MTNAPVLLSARSVEKRFRRKRVLQDVDLEVQAGEVVAIVGENGSGKSTLLNICSGVLSPTAGRVELNGRVGYCPQNPGVMSYLNAREHLRLASAGVANPKSAFARANAFLEFIGLDPNDRTTARNLSGGQRQKLNLALTMVADPHLLLLDEPYQGFDEGTYLNLWEQIERWRAEGRGVVVITHLLAEEDRVDRVLRMSDGRLVA